MLTTSFSSKTLWEYLTENKVFSLTKIILFGGQRAKLNKINFWVLSCFEIKTCAHVVTGYVTLKLQKRTTATTFLKAACSVSKTQVTECSIKESQANDLDSYLPVWHQKIAMLHGSCYENHWPVNCTLRRVLKKPSSFWSFSWKGVEKFCHVFLAKRKESSLMNNFSTVYYFWVIP